MDRIRFTDYEKIVDYLQAMKYLLLITSKYMDELESFEWIQLCNTRIRLETKLLEDYPDLSIHFECKTPMEKLKSIDFLLKLFEIGMNARVTI